jgi:UDP-N-acetylmuramate-alanine ligase
LKKYYFVVEADEFNRHLLLLDVDFVMITNIELDHSDVYHDFYTYLNIFKSFIYKTRYKVFLLELEGSTNVLKEIFHKKIRIAQNQKFDMKYLF